MAGSDVPGGGGGGGVRRPGPNLPLPGPGLPPLTEHPDFAPSTNYSLSYRLKLDLRSIIGYLKIIRHDLEVLFGKVVRWLEVLFRKVVRLLRDVPGLLEEGWEMVQQQPVVICVRTIHKALLFLLQLWVESAI